MKSSISYARNDSEFKTASYMESELPDIEDDYRRLLHLHRRLFDLKDPDIDSPKALLSTSACRLPRKNISSIKMVHKPYKIAICLPPKCGTTNWQKAMNVLEKDAKHKPPPSGEKYWKPDEFGYPDVYNILRNADITNSKDSKMISDWTKILNTRQGFIGNVDPELIDHILRLENGSTDSMEIM